MKNVYHVEAYYSRRMGGSTYHYITTAQSVDEAIDKVKNLDNNAKSVTFTAKLLPDIEIPLELWESE